MPNTREKLIELLKRTDREVYEALKDREDYREEMLWDYFASNLIANGVTFAKDINVLNKKIAELEKSNRNWRRKIQKIRQRYTKNNNAVWIPITERLPEPNQIVLSINPEYEEYQIGWIANSEEGGVVCVGDGIELYGVTHWMPLPQPPKGE